MDKHVYDFFCDPRNRRELVEIIAQYGHFKTTVEEQFMRDLGRELTTQLDAQPKCLAVPSISTRREIGLRGTGAPIPDQWWFGFSYDKFEKPWIGFYVEQEGSETKEALRSRVRPLFPTPITEDNNWIVWKYIAGWSGLQWPTDEVGLLSLLTGQDGKTSISKLATLIVDLGCKTFELVADEAVRKPRP